ncbi:uncharacterized protein BDV14DRAFT_195884 [Aspergillus stella-maris]|uniref:uncharacterized protein n=1 Tax=Aspergillus stella-maris TaxID=1810926 RepID=UPI003CCE2791
MRVLAVFTALLAVAFAQQGTNCREVHSPDTCANHGQVKCDGAGSFLVCCDRCF